MSFRLLTRYSIARSFRLPTLARDQASPSTVLCGILNQLKEAGIVRDLRPKLGRRGAILVFPDLLEIVEDSVVLQDALILFVLHKRQFMLHKLVCVASATHKPVCVAENGVLCHTNALVWHGCNTNRGGAR